MICAQVAREGELGPCKVWNGACIFPSKLEVSDALPSHGVEPTWGFHKVKLRKVKTWRHVPGFQL
jgi:hypothetical protein